MELGLAAPEDSWEKGQLAMRAGDPDEAILCYKHALAQRRSDSRNYLSLAAAYVAKGDELSASMALASFVEENPDQRSSRLYYAELLCRLGKLAEAECQFDRTSADLQDEQKVDYAQLVHCHGRLMELAEAQEDEYQVHLQRGIGLYWLAKGALNREIDPEEYTCESLLCKAAGELNLAHDLRPQEARPSWYLYAVWHSLAQSNLAQSCLREARAAAPFTFLSPAEQRSLQLAGHAAP